MQHLAGLRFFYVLLIFAFCIILIFYHCGKADTLKRMRRKLSNLPIKYKGRGGILHLIYKTTDDKRICSKARKFAIRRCIVIIDQLAQPKLKKSLCLFGIFVQITGRIHCLLFLIDIHRLFTG